MNIVQVATHFIDQLQKPDSDAFARLFTQDGLYADPAFGLARRGHEFVRLHHKKWHAAVPDFKAAIERVLVDGQSAVIMYDGTGSFNGEPLGVGESALRPTHKQFKARVVIVLDLNADGLVKSCTEYYDRAIMPCGEKAPYADDPRGLR